MHQKIYQENAIRMIGGGYISSIIRLIWLEIAIIVFLLVQINLC
jgi:hypothetical protein